MKDTAVMNQNIADIGVNYAEKYGFHDPEEYFHKGARGLNHEVVEMISQMKKEPDWMREFRHKALDMFLSKPMPTWGNTEILNAIDFDNIYYYIKPIAERGKSWDDIPESIKKTFDKLGVPEADKKFLAGISAQYESEVVYHSIKKELEDQGIISSIWTAVYANMKIS